VLAINVVCDVTPETFKVFSRFCSRDLSMELVQETIRSRFSRPMEALTKF
jgi:hypothetical protein